MEDITRQEYELINETKCGSEELFVLIGGFSKEYGLEELLKAIVKLVNYGYLSYSYQSTEALTQITLEQLKKYVQMRLDAGEELDEYPEVCDEYAFTATEKGLEILSEEDKPI